MPRPLSVTLLALAVLCIAVYNAAGAMAAIQGYTVLDTLPLRLPPAYFVARNALWMAVFAALALGLWRLWRWARRATPVAFGLYLALGWVERLVFAQSDYARASVPCFLLLEGVALALVWLVLGRRQTRQAFSDA
jgi:hypothetical protein